MDRRRFVKVAGAGMLVAAANARAQPAPRVYRLGILRPTAPFRDDRIAGGIPRALAELGYTEGTNLVIGQRFANGAPPRCRGSRASSSRLGWTPSSPSARRPRVRRRTRPPRFRSSSTAISIRWRADWPRAARPGGNVTGVLIAAEGTLAVKKLELLMEIAPRGSRIALLTPSDPGFALQLAEVRKAATALRRTSSSSR